ncbi:MAG: ATP-binding cassette domain-containing protein [Geminicoccaceae bacterium]|nr:ATP-binding cassette domain-containing protein [Geminicoccaceae bacterium]
MSEPTPPLLELERVSLAYGPVLSVREVSFAVRAGEVVGLVGDNGAGKSSIVKLVAGVHRPTSGTMRWSGRAYAPRGPREALEAGIATIHQHLALAPRLPVWQNLFLGCERVRRSWLLGLPVLDVGRMRAEARAALARLGITVTDVDCPVAELSGGQRQAVAIARALLWNARLLVMDEPTAALGVRETEEVRALIRRLKAKGVAVLLVSHDMQDVVAVADRVLVLKKGRLAAERAAAELDADRLAHLVMTAEAV